MNKGLLHRLKRKIIPKKKKSEVPFSFLGEVSPIDVSNPEDVFIIGFPKSGNTLLNHIIAHLFYGLNEKASRSMISLIVPDIHANTHYFRLNEICFFKSHSLPIPRYKKVIYIMRDGREALLSYYHMNKNMGQDISLEELFTGQTKIFGTVWHEHIAQWEKNPYQAEILWLKYEELVENKLKVLKKICGFLNIKRSEKELNQVVNLTSFKHMKNLEQRKDWQRMKNTWKTGTFFVRHGKIDSYKKEVNKALVSKFESRNKEMLEKYYS